MALHWDVETATGRCAATGRTLQEGEEFYTVLFETGESFTRSDYSVEAWHGPPEGAYCHFKTRVPVREKRKRLLVGSDLLIGFFERLAGETEPLRLQFRFVLALILMRKRLLRYEEAVVEEGIETWTMTLLRDQSKHRVVNPHLTDGQTEAVSRELAAILHSDMGEWASRSGTEAGGSGVESAPLPAPPLGADGDESGQPARGDAPLQS